VAQLGKASNNKHSSLKQVRMKEPHLLELSLCSSGIEMQFPTSQILLGLALIFSPLVGLAEDEPPMPVRDVTTSEPAKPAVPTATPEEIAKLINQLGADDFQQRTQASNRLEEVGQSAQNELLAGLKNEDPQIRRSCRRILADVLETDYQLRLKAFIEDVDGKQEHDIAGWKRFSEQVGTDKASRTLFIDMHKEERGLLASSEAGSGAAADALRMRFRQIYQGMHQRDSRSRKAPTPAAVATLLFVAANPELKLPSELVGHSYWSSLIGQQTFKKPLTDGPIKEPLRKLLGGWILTDSTISLLQQKLLLSVQNNLPEGLELALSVVKQKNVHANYRSYALHAIATLGGKEYTPVLLDLLEDNSECMRRVVRNGGKQEVVAIEFRDVALGWLIHLTGQEHKDYGQLQAKAAFDRLKKYPQNAVSAGNMGFQTKDGREKALAKWKVWQEENPFPELGEPQKALIAKAEKRDLSKTVNKRAFQPNIFFGPAKPVTGDPANDLERADRQYVRALKAAKTLIAERQFGEAAALLGEILATEDDYIYQPDRDVPLIRGFKAEAERLLGESTLDGLQAYQSLFGPQARLLLDEAILEGDAAGLSNVAERFFYTDEGAEAAFMLGGLYLSRHHPLRGAYYLQRVAERPDQAVRFEPGLSLRLATCWSIAGLQGEAERTLVALKAGHGKRPLKIGGEERPWFEQPSEAIAWLESQIGVQERLDRADNWMMLRGGPARNSESGAGGPYLAAELIAELTPDDKVNELAQTLQKTQLQRRETRMPSCAPLVVGNAIIVRLADRIAAYHFESHDLLWEVRHDDALAHVVDHTNDATKKEKNDFLETGLERRLWNNPTYGAASSDGKLVFTIEELAFGVGDNYQRLVVTADGSQQLDTGTQKSHNVLTAYDLTTGKLRWETGGATGVESANVTGVYFLGPPLPLGGRLYVIGQAGYETRLMELSASTGKLTWEIVLQVDEPEPTNYSIATMPAWMLEDPSRRSGATPSTADGVLVCPLSENDFAAVDLTTRHVLWMYRHEKEELAYNNSNRWQQQLYELSMRRNKASWGDCVPTIAGGKVLITPVDSSAMYCLNLRDGELLWTAPRRGGFYIAGVKDNRVVVVGGSGIWALDLEDGTPLWDGGDVPLPDGAAPTGRGYFSGDEYFLPLSSGEVASVDVVQGRLVSRSLVAQGSSGAGENESSSDNFFAPGNLVACRGDVLSQSGLNLLRYETLATRQQRLEDEVENNSTAVLLTDLGEVSLFRGELPKAAEYLQQAIEQANAAEKPRAQKLLTETLIEGVRSDFVAFAPLVEKYGQPDPTTPTGHRMLRQLAEAYQRAGDYERSFEMYMQLAGHEKLDELRYVAAERQCRVDRWLAGQIDSMLNSAQGEQAVRLNERIEALLADGAAPHELALLSTRSQTDGARIAEAVQKIGKSEFLPAEQILRDIFLRGQPTQQRESAALLADMYRKAKQPHASARMYRYMQETWPDEICLNGKKPAELMAMIPADDEVQKLTTNSDLYPMIEPSVTSKKRTVSIPYRYPIAVKRIDPRIDAEFTFQIDTQGRNLTCLNWLGKEKWTMALPASTSQWRYSGSIFSHSRGMIMGHLLVLWTADRVIAIDLLGATGKVIWRKDTITSSAPYPGMYRTPPVWLASVRTLASPVDSLLTPLAASSRTVIYQAERDLIALDPLTGKEVWKRENLASYGDILSTDQEVVFTPRNGSTSTVFNPLDGSEIDHRRASSLDERILIRGVDELRWESTPKGDRQLSLRNAATGTEHWALEIGGGAKVWPIDAERVAVLTPAGIFQVVSVVDGKTIFQGEGAVSDGLQSFLAWRTLDGYMLATNCINQPGPGNQIFTSIMNGATPINGSVVRFKTGSAKPLWNTPMQEHMLKIEQASGQPVVVLLNQLRVMKGKSMRTQWRLSCIDKRNGSILYDQTTDGSNNLFQVDLDRTKKVVEVKTRVATLTLSYDPETIKKEKEAAEKEAAEKKDTEKDATSEKTEVEAELRVRQSIAIPRR